MDIQESGIFDIQLSDSEDESKKVDRTNQTEAEFQVVKEDYRAKVENGEIRSSINLPLALGVKKQLVQETIHAVEELYFFGRFQEALDFISLIHADGSADALDKDSHELLRAYQVKCEQKANSRCH